MGVAQWGFPLRVWLRTTVRPTIEQREQDGESGGAPDPYPDSARHGGLDRGEHQEQDGNECRQADDRCGVAVIAERVFFRFFGFSEHKCVRSKKFKKAPFPYTNYEKGAQGLPPDHPSRAALRNGYLYSFQALIFRSSRPIRQKAKIKSLASRALVISGMLKSMAERRIV